ncbi:Rrf2 family transcriptional regulator [Thermosipho melanesiensis]|uniref:Transcriptional regulator, BadM/Rrf2 family n=2 Tax=Thermosipho melanesiensis TaxID=46541 RepID=A6LNA2_THEM4|nr:Rrf2 family transcriptional regulator [Thermosipho melanesiensis]ABR31403.1 transcriptional regulator, BadM/Rrf2 family [Thermosipho melanesiensis BI429]APT74462.1 Rrf2 family transcriptional regulator [Thermosipho melanesiensis]OOC36422.1 Rrf2 family transcriptional regulator [Thermosipho melanesiensis]OOC37240.1 Rrf2 family transcriptional regulator [Thermosipho melanesiensis]OOC37992.1 Rrf2 family transcriptional regulator [Thermosipho melanesiensis]
MAVTMKSEYALRLLLLLSLDEKLVSTRELISKCKADIPYEFAQKILSRLVSSGILSSSRGKFGGYKLTKKPSEITIYDIVSAVDDISTVITCFVEPGKMKLEPEICTVNEIWQIVMEKFSKSLMSVTLEDLKKSYLKKCEEFGRRNKL